MALRRNPPLATLAYMRVEWMPSRIVGSGAGTHLCPLPERVQIWGRHTVDGALQSMSMLPTLDTA